MAVVLMVAGASGIFLARFAELSRGFGGRRFPSGGVMPMMGRGGGGMMGDGGMMGRDRMREMMKGMMGDMLPPGVNPEDLPDPDSPGAKLVARFCGQCHEIPSPAMHTKEEWPGVVGRMFGRMSMMSRKPMMQGIGMEFPSAEQRQVIVDYMVAHAMKPAELDTLPQPESAGAVSFKTVCSQCHPLPDPGLHTAGEWPAVVERMRTHMKETGKGEITDHELEEILGYLSRNVEKR